MKNIMTYPTFGLTVFFALLFPPIGSYLLHYGSGGMHGIIFGNHPPVVYLSIDLLLTYTIPLIFTIIFVKVTDFTSRVPLQKPGKVFLLSGAAIFLLPQFLRLLTSTIPGGGVSYALMGLAAPFVFVAKLLLIIGAIKLFMSIKPSDGYIFPKQPSPNSFSGGTPNTIIHE